MQSVKTIIVVVFAMALGGRVIAAPTTDFTVVPKTQGNVTTPASELEKDARIVNAFSNDKLDEPLSSELMMQKHIQQLVENDYRY